MEKVDYIVSTLFVVQLFWYYHEVSAESCRAIYGERFRCISPDACAQKNRIWTTRCGPKKNGVCCQVMDEDHRNFKRCGIRVQRRSIHRHHPYESSSKRFQSSSESMRDAENIAIPWVILANRDNNFGDNSFQKDYIVLSNSKQRFYKSWENSNNQKENNQHGENTDDDRYLVEKDEVTLNSSSRDSTLKTKVPGEIVELPTKQNTEINGAVYNNGENIKMTSVDLPQSTNSCGPIGCSTDIIVSVVNDDVKIASKETSKKGSEEIYFKNYKLSTNSQVSVTENNKIINSKDMNLFKNESSFNETFDDVPSSTSSVTSTVMIQNSEENLKQSLEQEDILNNSYDIITTEEEKFNSTNGEYYSNKTLKNMENTTKLQYEASSVEAVESEEKDNLQDDSEQLKRFSSVDTVAVENESTSNEMYETEQKTNSESLVEVVNGNYSSQEFKSEKNINTQSTLDLSNENVSKLASEYEETTKVQQTHYKDESESAKKKHSYDNSEVVTENSMQEKTTAAEDGFSDTIFPDEKENISKPSSEYEKKTISGISNEMLKERSLSHGFETEEAIIVQNTTELLNESSSILVHESEETTNIQETAESANENYYKEEYELKEKTDLESLSENVTEGSLEESVVFEKDYFSEATKIEEINENISKSDSEAKEKTISNIFTEMTNEISFSQELKSEETLNLENTFKLPNESSSKFVSESEDTTNVKQTAESTNETNHNVEHELEEKTNLENNSKIVTESPSKKNTKSGEDYFSEATKIEAIKVNVSKSDSETKEKTISNIFTEMTKEISFSQESKSEETLNVENTFEMQNESSSKFVPESEDTTNVKQIAESTNETKHNVEHELEEKTNLENNSKIVAENPSKESTKSGEDYFSEATKIEAIKVNVSKSDSETKEKTISNIFTEMTKEISFIQESKSEETLNVENTFKAPNESSSKFVSESEDTTIFQQTAESTNETNYKEEHELEGKTNLESSSGIVTESSLEETTKYATDYLSEATTIEEKEEIISKPDSEIKEKIISNIFTEMTNNNSFSQESKSEETINVRNTFEMQNESSSKFVSESEDTTNVQQTAESTNETNHNVEHELEEKTNLENNSKIVTESPSKESIKSGEDYFSEATKIEAIKVNISKSDSETKEKTISNIFTEMTKENSFSQESKSEETLNVENTFEMQNESSSKFLSELEDTTNVQQTVESANETNYKKVHKLEEKTNLDDSSKIVTESPVEESTKYREDYFSEAAKIEEKEENVSKSDFEAKEKTISNIFTEMTNENSFSQELKSEQTINVDSNFKARNENFPKFLSKSENTTIVQQTTVSTNETNYKIEHELEEERNLEESSKIVTETQLKESTKSGEDYFPEATTIEVAKENVSKTDSKVKEKMISNIFTEMPNENSFSQESKSEKTINEANTFVMPNETSSKFVASSEDTTTVQETAESKNETHYEEELEKKTNLNDSNGIVTDSLEERAQPEEKYFTITTAEVENISKFESESENNSVSEITVETTNINSLSQVSNSEKQINAQTIDLLNESTSKSISESQQISNAQENFHLLNETNFEEDTNLEQNTDLESNSELVTESSLNKMTVSKEKIIYEATVNVEKGNVSKSIFESEKYTENFTDASKEDSLNQELKSNNISNVEISTELQSENSSIFEILENESKGTTNVHESSELSNQTYFHGGNKMTISKEKIIYETTVNVEKENVSKPVFESEGYTKNPADSSKEDSLNQELKSNNISNVEINTELQSENSSIFETLEYESKGITNVYESSELSNQTYFQGENKMTISKEKIIYEATVNVEKENVSKPVFESEGYTKNPVDASNENSLKETSQSEEKSNSKSFIEISNENSSTQKPESEKLTKDQNKFEIANEDSSKVMSKTQTTVNIQDTYELNNVSLSKFDPEFEEKTNFEDSKHLAYVSTFKEEPTDKITISKEKNDSESVTQLVNENISKGGNKTEEKTIWETIIESVTKMFSKQLTESEKINLVSTVEMSNQGYSETTHEYEEKTNQVSTVNFDKDVSGFKEDIGALSSDKLTNKKYDMEVSQKGVTTKAYDVEINDEITSKEVNVYEEVINEGSTIGSTGEKSSPKVSADGEKTITEISMDAVKEDNDEKMSQLLLESSSGISTKVENEKYPEPTSEIKETTNPSNNAEATFEVFSKDLSNHTKIIIMESKTELKSGISYKESTDSEEQTNPMASDLMIKRNKTEEPEMLVDTSMSIAGEMANENISTGKFESEETINHLNNSETVFRGNLKYLSNYTEVNNLGSEIELKTVNSYKESTESVEEINLMTFSDLMNESTNREVSEILVDKSMSISGEMSNENISISEFVSGETINPLNNSETAFQSSRKYFFNNTEMSNLDRKTELKPVTYYKKSTESKEETNPMTSSDLMNKNTEIEVPENLMNTYINIAGERVNENISTGIFESEKTTNTINNFEMVFEGYSENVFEHTKSSNMKSNIELRNESSFSNITETVQEADPNKLISNGITRHLMIEDEILGKSYATTTEEEIRLSNTAIKFYDGRENIHPNYNNEKEIQNNYTEIIEYSTNTKKNLDIKIVTSSSNKTDKTVTEENKTSKSFEILTKAPTHVTRTQIVLKAGEENVTIVDLENFTNSSSKEIHESLGSNTNITVTKTLTNVSSESALNVSDSFYLTTKYPNHFSNAESQIYKTNAITTSQDFVDNENVSHLKETSEYLENINDTSETVTDDGISFSNTEINFQQSKINVTLEDAAKNEGIGVEMNTSASYVSFSEISINEIFTKDPNWNTSRRTKEYDTLNEEAAVKTQKNKNKYSNNEINFHKNEEKVTEGTVFETFVTGINETSTEAGEVLSKYFDVSTGNKIHITNTDIYLYNNMQNISTHKAPGLQAVKNEDITESNNKNAYFLTKYTMSSLKHDITSKYSSIIEKKYHKYPDETTQKFLIGTTAVPLKPDHTNHLNDYKYDIHKMNTYTTGNNKLQPLENIYKYYDYGGQSFNPIHQAALDEYHKAYFLTHMLENQPAFVHKFQNPMFYQNPHFMNERPINFPQPYYESKVLHPYVQSYPYLYDQFNVKYPLSHFYQVGLYQQPIFSHNMAIPLSNNYRPYYGSENYQPSIQSYPSMYNKQDLRYMYPYLPVDFSTLHQARFYRQQNPMYMIANPYRRRYRRSYGSESLLNSAQPNLTNLKDYYLNKIEENQSTDIPKYQQGQLKRQLNPMYGIAESLSNKDNTYILADFKYYHPFFLKRHLNVLDPFERKGQVDEFANKGESITERKPEMSYFGTKYGPLKKSPIKKRKHYTKSNLKKGNRSLNSVGKKTGIDSPAFTGNSNTFSNSKKDIIDMERTEKPFRKAYREFIDRYNLLHVIEYLPQKKTYRNKIFKNQTLQATEKKKFKFQTEHYSVFDKIFRSSTDYYKAPGVEKYFTSEYTVRKKGKYSKAQSDRDKFIEKSNEKVKRQKINLKPIRRNLNSIFISETKNILRRIKNANSSKENTLNSYLQENVTLSNYMDGVLTNVDSFLKRPKFQKTNVRRSNVPGISHREVNLGEGRTIGGKLEYENWTWMVSIYRLPDMFHACSGTLIDERHILAAAHCFIGHDFAEYVASVGNLLKISDPNQGYLVEDMVLHTDFKRDCYCNDIALLRLKYTVDDHLTPICLSAIDTAAVGENTTLLGWGDVKFMAGRGMSGTDRLQRVNNLPIRSSEECRKIYTRILNRNLPRNFSESYICAGIPDGSKDSCVGDSGGPLLHRSYDGSWTLLGIVSFGYKCGTPGVPGIYTRVSYYLQWIYGAIDKFDSTYRNNKRHSN